MLCARLVNVGPLSTGYERPISSTCPWSTGVPPRFASEQVSWVVHFSVAPANDIDIGTVARGKQIWKWPNDQRPNAGDGLNQSGTYCKRKGGRGDISHGSGIAQQVRPDVVYGEKMDIPRPIKAQREE